MSGLPLGYWSASWEWGVPMILLTVVAHVLGLGAIRLGVSSVLRHPRPSRRRRLAQFAVGPAIAVVLVTGLHALEAGIWAWVYVLTRALPDYRWAMLYSMNSMTTFGHAAIYLAPRWQMLGAIESLNGLILFGLTTAVLFGVIERAWPFTDR